MNIKNKIFRYTKLLLVLIILVIIYMLLVPTIKKTINDIDKDAVDKSVYSTVKNTKIKIAIQSMTTYIRIVESSIELNITLDTGSTNSLSGIYTILKGNLMDSNKKILTVDMTGTKPQDHFGSIQLLDDKVINANLKFDGIELTYKNINVSGTTIIL